MTHVLIVDDKEENLYYLRALLTGHGFTVDAAHHGAEALFRARQALPDLVVSDLLMPVMDGYTLLRHWKLDRRLQAVPFIVYTATYTAAADEQLALNLGADAFILKPAEPQDFIARLREVQANKRAAVPTPPKHQIGDEKELLKVYSETLIRKLEEKTLQLEEANRTLQHDIAGRKVAEENLRESEERFRATFEQAAVGIAHVELDGKFLRVNDKLCEITGYARAELLTRTYTELTLPEDRGESDEARRAMLARTRSNYSTEKRYQRKDARLFWVSVVTTLLRDPIGEPKYFISVFTDITERRVLQEQLLRAQRMESIGTLAGGIAHDLNNILAPIMMGASLLKRKDPDESSLRVIDLIEHSASRGANLVKQVLFFARGVEGAHVPVHLGRVVHEIEEFAQSTFPKAITFTTHVPKETWLVQGDPTQLNQVLLNLCVNARDAMPTGGRLDLTAQNVDIDGPYAAMLGTVPAGRYVVLEVTDTGTGIPPEVQGRIFEAFFTTKEPGKGTGLGLSTVLSIVRSHGGNMRVESKPGRGSTFKVFLPAQVESIAREEPAPMPPAPPSGRGELILLVDDDATVLAITRHTLETYDYRVLTAEDGAHAIGLYALQRDEIALVITDMMMPVMDGPALIKALRRINSGVRIMVASGLQGNEAPATAAGVKHFIAKPFSTAALLTRLRQALDDN